MNLTTTSQLHNRPNAENPPPCHGRSELFLIGNAHAYAETKPICDTCPFLKWCETERDHTLTLRPNSLEGTWAGVLYKDNRSRQTIGEDVA